MRVNAEIILEPGDDAAVAWKRLHKFLMKNGTYTAASRHASYRKPSEAARIKSAKARRRVRKDVKRRAMFEPADGPDKTAHFYDRRPGGTPPRPTLRFTTN